MQCVHCICSASFQGETKTYQHILYRCIYVTMYVCLSVWMYVALCFACLFVCLLVRLFVCLFSCLLDCLCVCLSVCLFVCLACSVCVGVSFTCYFLLFSFAVHMHHNPMPKWLRTYGKDSQTANNKQVCSYVYIYIFPLHYLKAKTIYNHYVHKPKCTAAH